MGRNKRDFHYPILRVSEKQAVYDYLCACREDFCKGRDKLKLMYKISPEDWIMKNIQYFQHCISGVDYAHARLKLPQPKAVK